MNLGSNTNIILHYAPYDSLYGLTANVLGEYHYLTDRIFWWLPFFIISFFSITLLYRKIFPENSFWFFSPLVFVFNTYILMLLGGGQIAGIGMAYAIAPLVLYVFIGLWSFYYEDTSKFKTACIIQGILTGLVLAIQVMFDIRIVYITMITVLVYGLLRIEYKLSKKNFLTTVYIFLYTFIIPIGTTLLLQAYWIVPAIFVHRNPLTQLGLAYSSEKALEFFSFAKLENTVGLLHPNWPDNVFGKVSFMKPEFLFFPFLAYISLLFLKNVKFKTQNEQLTLERQNYTENQYIVFFAIVGLLGSFLAKGTNPPFGEIYLWLFNHLPGFVLFRDSTKWYLMIAISYSILIPYSLSKLLEKVSSIKYKVISGKNINRISYPLFFIIFVIFWLLTIRSAIFRELTGTFASSPIPSEYMKLNEFLASQNKYFRTLWIPTYQRFGYYSFDHPAIYASDFFGTSDEKKIIASLTQENTQKKIQEAAVKYIIIPYDTQGNISIQDRKYNELLYQQSIKQMEQVTNFQKVYSFGKIIVFAVSTPKDHIWISSFSKNSASVSYTMISPITYDGTVQNAKQGDTIIFAESYDPLWQMSDGSNLIKSQPYDKLFNSFSLKKSGNYSITINYQAQKWVNGGVIISAISVIIIISILLFNFRKRLYF